MVPRKQAGDEWNEGFEFITNLVKAYLEHGKYSEVLKSVKLVGVGFVDGDIDIVYQSEYSP